jgi:hypothetical protein
LITQQALALANMASASKQRQIQAISFCAISMYGYIKYKFHLSSFNSSKNKNSSLYSEIPISKPKDTI